MKMEKTGLVLEGGGIRGAYTVGVLSWLADHHVQFDYSAGISSGAMYLACFVIGRMDIGYRIATEHAIDPSVAGPQAFLREGHYVAYSHLLKDAILGKERFDVAELLKRGQNMEVGVYDLDLGRTVFYPESEDDEEMTLIRAACGLPIASAIVEFKGHHFLDGGVTKMIPIERAVEQGCTKCFIITTKPADYVRKPAPWYAVEAMRRLYPQCPQLTEDYKVRHINYYKQMDMIGNMVEEGTGLLMRPTKTVSVSRFKGDPDKCRELYELGYQDAEKRKDEILSFLKAE